MNGTEWIVDAQGCSAESLRTLNCCENLFQQIIADLDLRTIGETHWHQFPGTGGITGLCLCPSPIWRVIPFRSSDRYA